MESFFNTSINTNIETDNIVYNVINSNSPTVVFFYITIIIIATFISTKLNYNTNILIGLVFASIIIYYFYTYRKYRILSETQIQKEKFNQLYSKNNILEKYPKIVDFLFFIENFKSENIQEYLRLVEKFEEFCKLYEFCLLDYNLISTNYSTLVDQKIKILNNINCFIFSTDYIELENILIKQRISAEKILDELLNNLVKLEKKNIYYDGYNVKTQKISDSNVLAYNILYDVNYRTKYDQFNMANLTFY